MAVTMKQIAELCHVSIATVSKIVNGKDDDIGEETKRRVLKAIEEKGYRMNALAQSMKTKNTKTLGLIIPDIKNAYYTDISRGAEDMAHKKGYNLFLCNTDDKIEKEISHITKLMEKQVDGIIIIASLERNLKREESLDITIPFAVLNKSMNYKDYSVKVEVNSHMGMYEGVMHLLDLGHRNIMYIQGETALHFGEERLSGYRDALEKYGVPYREDFVAKAPFTVEGAYDYLKAHGIREGTTAVVCGNDLMAFGVFNWAKENGLDVPSDLSVMGFDDTIFSTISSPKITTISQHCHEVGAVLVEELIKQIDSDRDIKMTVSMDTNLVIRESTAKPKVSQESLILPE